MRKVLAAALGISLGLAISLWLWPIQAANNPYGIVKGVNGQWPVIQCGSGVTPQSCTEHWVIGSGSQDPPNGQGNDGDLFWRNDLLALRTRAAGVWGPLSLPGRFSLAADYTNATTTFSNVALSTINLTNARRYAFEMSLWLAESTAADGVKLDFNGGGATVTTFLAQCLLISDTGTAVTQANATSAALATVINASATATTNVHLYSCSGFILPSSTGTFIIRAAQNAHSSGTLTIKAGSWIQLEDTP